MSSRINHFLPSALRYRSNSSWLRLKSRLHPGVSALPSGWLCSTENAMPGILRNVDSVSTTKWNAVSSYHQPTNSSGCPPSRQYSVVVVTMTPQKLSLCSFTTGAFGNSLIGLSTQSAGMSRHVVCG
jgi:hypothetical protein